MARYYKFLTADGKGAYSGYRWPLPTKNDDGTWTPGEWTPALDGEPSECQHGYHFCRAEQLLGWLNATLYELQVEAGAGVQKYKDKCATTARCRLLKRIDAWNERTARLFACDCAERVLPLYERRYPDDTGPRHAIETARRYAGGQATKEELAAARAAAWAAERRAAWDAERRAAWAAAWAAARAAAWAAERDASRAAAWDAERQWQTKHLCEMLGQAVEVANTERRRRIPLPHKCGSLLRRFL